MLVLVGPESLYEGSTAERLVISPTMRGTIIVRAVISARDSSEQLSQMTAAQRELAIEPISALDSLGTLANQQGPRGLSYRARPSWPVVFRGLGYSNVREGIVPDGCVV